MVNIFRAIVIVGSYYSNGSTFQCKPISNTLCNELTKSHHSHISHARVNCNLCHMLPAAGHPSTREGVCDYLKLVVLRLSSDIQPNSTNWSVKDHATKLELQEGLCWNRDKISMPTVRKSWKTKSSQSNLLTPPFYALKKPWQRAPATNS